MEEKKGKRRVGEEAKERRIVGYPEADGDRNLIHHVYFIYKLTML